MKHEMNYNFCNINPFDQLMMQSADCICDNENDLRSRIWHVYKKYKVCTKVKAAGMTAVQTWTLTSGRRQSESPISLKEAIVVSTDAAPVWTCPLSQCLSFKFVLTFSKKKKHVYADAHSLTPAIKTFVPPDFHILTFESVRLLH